MITHKSSISNQFPLTIKFSIKRKNLYLFPQGWAWVGGFAECRYVASDGEYDVWEEVHYKVPNGYAFSWLFIHIVFEIRKNKGNIIMYEKKPLHIPDVRKSSLL